MAVVLKVCDVHDLKPAVVWIVNVPDVATLRVSVEVVEHDNRAKTHRDECENRKLSTSAHLILNHTRDGYEVVEEDNRSVRWDVVQRHWRLYCELYLYINKTLTQNIHSLPSTPWVPQQNSIQNICLVPSTLSAFLAARNSMMTTSIALNSEPVVHTCDLLTIFTFIRVTTDFNDFLFVIVIVIVTFRHQVDNLRFS